MSRRPDKVRPAADATSEACGRLVDGALCEAAVDELAELVIESGGLSEQEALLLVAILGRLERLQDAEGPGAALHAARTIRRIWMEGDRPEELATPN